MEKNLNFVTVGSLEMAVTPEQNDRWHQERVAECHRTLENILRVYVGEVPTWKVLELTAFLAMCSREGVFKAEEMQTRSADDKKDTVSELLQWIGQAGRERLFRLVENYDAEIFETLAMTYVHDRRNQATGPSLRRLGYRLLDVKPDEAVAEFCSGIGLSATELSMQVGHPIDAYESDEENVKAARLYGDATECGPVVHHKDIFLLGEDEKYDKIICFPPSGSRIESGSPAEAFYMKNIKTKTPGNITTEGFLFDLKILEQLNAGGRAVVSHVFSETERRASFDLRREAVMTWKLEAVIALPVSLSLPAAEAEVLMVYANREDDFEVTFVDARHLSRVNRRAAEMTEEDIEEVLKLVNTDGVYSKTMDLRDVCVSGCNLNPLYYLREKIAFKDEKPLRSVVKEFGRGPNLRASELDELASETPTTVCYISQADLQDGTVVIEEKYLKEDIEVRGSTVHSGDLLLSRTGPDFRSAVAEFPEGMEGVCSGNLLILRVNRKKLDPYYLQAFFQSAVGRKVLEGAVRAGRLPLINMSDLKGLKIPVPPMDIQDKVARKYRTCLGEVIRFRRGLREAVERLSTVIDDVTEQASVNES